MRTNLVFVIWMLLFVAACSKGPIAPGAIVSYQNIKMEKCDADTINTYHILVPESSVSQNFPLVIVLDAHGSGGFAVRNFKDAVKDFPCLVAGSDLIKNNYQDFENAILQLIRDVEIKYPVNEQNIILAGFSGGARMAYYFSVKYQVKGLLMLGAGPGQQKPSCPVYMIAGMGDFNFAEQFSRPNITSFSEEQQTTAFFHGVHEWPEPDQLADALLFLLSDSEDMKSLRRNRSRELIKVADSLSRGEEQIMAWQALEKAAKISVNNASRKKAVKRGNALLENDEFQESIRNIEKHLRTEQKLQQGYAQAMSTKDFDWWKNELDLLDKKLKDSYGIEKDHFLRVKGFIGILFYSRVNNLINTDPGNPQLKTMLQSYAYAEPENPDPYYFMAMYALTNGDKQACIENRNKAIELGLSDQQKLMNISF